MKRLKNTKGFTLIEFVIVLIIIAVLMAIAVPSIMKYAGIGAETKALDEAYACVSAGDYYGVRVHTNGQYLLDIKESHLKKRAGVNGTIENFTYDQNDYTIIGLRYKSKDGIIVTFKNDKYLVNKDEDWDIENLLSKLQYIDKENDLSKYLETGPKAKAAQELQRLYKEQNKNQYFPLSQTEKDLLLNQVPEGFYKGPKVDDLIWKPVYSSDGSIILCADNINTTTSNVVTPMIYYKGNYYVHLFTYQEGATPQLNSAYVNEYSLPIVDNEPYEPNNPSKNAWVHARQNLLAK